MGSRPRALEEIRTVTLFVTCTVDALYPEIGEAVVEILERLGLRIEFPKEQTCCGRFAYSTGCTDDARALALRFLDIFKHADVIVTPSGSCAAMIRHGYLDIFREDATTYSHALQVAERTWEFSQFIVDGLGVTDLGAHFNGRVLYVDPCRTAYELGITRPPRVLLGHVSGAQLIELPDRDCCMSEMAFATRMPELASAITMRLARSISRVQADAVITSEAGCVAQLSGALRRAGIPAEVYHLAQFLARHMT
ncbi:MAG: (Fe-S)-binding protein [Anaerolineae bacterium]|nr:(Fe-S)-binding protein [Anaerolineae bacterium]